MGGNDEATTPPFHGRMIDQDSLLINLEIPSPVGCLQVSELRPGVPGFLTAVRLA